MSRIRLEFDDSPEVRKALQYLANFAREDEAEFWRTDGPEGAPVPEMADAYEHVADTIEMVVLPMVPVGTPEMAEFDNRLKKAQRSHDETAMVDLGPQIYPEDV